MPLVLEPSKWDGSDHFDSIHYSDGAISVIREGFCTHDDIVKSPVSRGGD